MAYCDSEKARTAQYRDYWEDLYRIREEYCDFKKATRTYQKDINEDFRAKTMAQKDLLKDRHLKDLIKTEDGSYEYPKWQILPRVGNVTSRFIAFMGDNFIENPGYDTLGATVVRNFKPDFFLISENLWTYNISSKSTIN